jgi:hypothetical protein
MLNERDLVVLTHDCVQHGLLQGDVGTIVHCYESAAAFEVEFVTAEGATVVVLTLEKEAIRPVGGQEILHVRTLAIAPA